MLTRTIEKTVTFHSPFIFGTLKEQLPAGEYTVSTDEELIQGLSFTAYRRVLTLFHIPEKSGKADTMRRTITIDHDDLDKALAKDAAEEEDRQKQIYARPFQGGRRS